jgi:formylmethanofuran dehydrogenase subunit E
VIIEQGKFHGVIAPQTPIGWRMASSRASGRWVGMVSP